jgi:hypothetical protein
LVAHADTVYPDIDGVIDIGFEDGIFYSKNRDKEIEYTNRWGIETSRRGVGIGADDRAGCAIVWNLRKLGHSILITSGEEVGCVATHRLMNTPYWYDEINTTHRFAVEFDRRGNKDIVFYRVGTDDFANYVKAETKYIPAPGSVTDISHLCRLICGVNMSVGYYNEHNTEEKLVYNQWQNTLAVAHDWLRKDNLPLFPLERDKIFEIYGRYSNNFYTPKISKPKIKKKEQKESTRVQISPAITDITGRQWIKCPLCGERLSDEDLFFNNFNCTSKHCGLKL